MTVTKCWIHLPSPCGMQGLDSLKKGFSPSLRARWLCCVRGYWAPTVTRNPQWEVRVTPGYQLPVCCASLPYSESQELQTPGTAKPGTAIAPGDNPASGLECPVALAHTNLAEPWLQQQDRHWSVSLQSSSGQTQHPPTPNSTHSICENSSAHHFCPDSFDCY